MELAVDRFTPSAAAVPTSQFSTRDTIKGAAIKVEGGSFHQPLTVRQLLRSLEPISCEASCESVLLNFLHDRELYALPVIDKLGRPVALIDRKEYIEFFSKTYTREIFGRRNVLTLLVQDNYKNHKPIVVEENCSVEDAARLILQYGMEHMVTGFVITANDRYLGVASGHDLLGVITQRKQDELAQFNMVLEARVAARTAELEAANKQLASFSYTIAHDLRAPVRAINGFSEMVLKENAGVLDPDAVRKLGRVVAGSRRMGELIDDLLILARLSRQELKRQQISVSALAAGVVANLAHTEPARSVTVNIEPDMRVWGDAGLLRSLLENLIGNAWKYTGKSTVATIEFGQLQRDGQKVYFIRDNGAGFDMRYAQKLFTPFQRLHHASEFEGTGIGLATVKKIIERHDGTISIESAVNTGTTVFFTLGDQRA